MLKRLLGEETGAVAMEYIVIGLLVAAAVVGLIMVFSGELRNMLGTTNTVMNQKTVEGVEKVAGDFDASKDKYEKQNTAAKNAGNKIGGDFSDGK